MRRAISTSLVLALSTLFAAACGGSSPAATGEGTVQRDWPFANPLQANALLNVIAFASGNTSSTLQIVLHTKPIAQCVDLAGPPEGTPNLDTLTIAAWDTGTVQSNGDALLQLPTSPGDFPIYAVGMGGARGNVSGIGIREWDASGNLVNGGVALYASSGTVHLDEVSSSIGGKVSGSFDARFPNSWHLTGSFSTTVCGQLVETSP